MVAMWTFLAGSAIHPNSVANVASGGFGRFSSP